MLMRRLGRTGLKVAGIVLGGNTFGWTTDEAASFAVLDAYVEAGGNCIDTADVYSTWVPGNSGGESETVIGNWLAQRGGRDSLVMISKVGQRMGHGANESGLSRSHIMRGVEASLKRLRTDYIDVYLSHVDDTEVTQEETLRAYDDLVRQGKVHYVGAATYPAWRLVRARWLSDRHGWANYEALEPKYNLFDREPYEREYEPVCQDLGLGVITNTSLAQGFLSGKYRPDAPLPESARAPRMKGYMNERGFRILSELDTVAAAHDATVAQVALAWVLARPSITAPVVSATSPQQLHELLGATELTLTAEALEALDRVSA